MKRLFLGPPGTGKTTTLLDTVERELETTPPNRIAYVSFTRAAVKEAVARACSRFSYEPSDFPYFRTLHSLCYLMSGIKKDEVMQHEHYRQFGENFGWYFKDIGIEQPTRNPYTIGDALLRLYQNARATCTPHMEIRTDFDPSIYIKFVERFLQYKKQNNIVDFFDFLDQTNRELPVDVLIIDEAQDLTTQQWQFIERISPNVKRTYYAGDDDQSIYEWAGADVNQFLNLRAVHETLPRTFRFGPNIRGYAGRIASQINRRYRKEWETLPDAQDTVEYVPLADTRMAEGEWLLLARTNRELNKLVRHARASGRLYAVQGQQPAQATPAARAIGTYVQLQRGAYVPLGALMAVRQFSSNPFAYEGDGLRVSRSSFDHDFNIPWREALDKIPLQEQVYWSSIKEDLSKPAKVRIQTIHASKGMEADNVVLLNHRFQPSDEELRVWYVGATRARKRLVISGNGTL